MGWGTSYFSLLSYRCSWFAWVTKIMVEPGAKITTTRNTSSPSVKRTGSFCVAPVKKVKDRMSVLLAMGIKARVGGDEHQAGQTTCNLLFCSYSSVGAVGLATFIIFTPTCTLYFYLLSSRTLYSAINLFYNFPECDKLCVKSYVRSSELESNGC